MLPFLYGGVSLRQVAPHGVGMTTLLLTVLTHEYGSGMNGRLVFLPLVLLEELFLAERARVPRSHRMLQLMPPTLVRVFKCLRAVLAFKVPLRPGGEKEQLFY